MKLDELLATARVVERMHAEFSDPPHFYSRKFAADVVAYHEGAAGKLRTELVAWAKRWRDETCSRLGDCDPQTGDHDDHCSKTVNEIDGIALIDALAIAEHEEAKSHG